MQENDEWNKILKDKKEKYQQFRGTYIDAYKNKMRELDEKGKFCKSWYWLFDHQITNISKLASELDSMQLHEKLPKYWFVGIHRKIYNYLSEFSHGIKVLEAINMTDNEIQFNDIHNLINASVGIIYIYHLVETYNACVSSFYPNLKFDTIDLIFLKKLAEQIYKLDKQ